jgi:GT2 family glycosyltransferase
VNDLTVVTSTIPERADMLAELAGCMQRQTVAPDAWLVHVDETREGPAACLNRLVAAADTEWVFRADDDDLFDDDHFETIIDHLGDDVDFVYSWPRCEPGGWIGERGLQVVHPIKTLRVVNWIASAAAVRRSTWLDLGGLNEDPEVLNEDHDFIARLVDAGARFRLAPAITWTYRLGDWPHRSQGDL